MAKVTISGNNNRDNIDCNGGNCRGTGARIKER